MWKGQRRCRKASMAVLYFSRCSCATCLDFLLCPVGPASSLFEKSYYELMKKALKEDGILCTQGMPLGKRKAKVAVCRRLDKPTSISWVPCLRIKKLISPSSVPCLL